MGISNLMDVIQQSNNKIENNKIENNNFEDIFGGTPTSSIPPTNIISSTYEYTTEEYMINLERRLKISEQEIAFLKKKLARYENTDKTYI